MLTLTDIRWAAEECERQQSGELSVANLCNALDFAKGYVKLHRILELPNIVILGQLVEPEKNKNGFRKVPVHFADFSTALPPGIIESALRSLIQNGRHLSATEWYKEFESIHPFIDGNGRVGAILFNVRNGTLNEPITPPNIFTNVTASAKG